MNSLRFALRFAALMSAIILSGCTTETNSTPTSANELKITLTTEPNPPPIGEGKLIIDIVDAAGQPLEDLKVDVSFGMSSMTMGTQDGQTDRQGKGRYVRRVTFHIKGEYTVRVWVRRDGKTLKTQDFKFTGG